MSIRVGFVGAGGMNSAHMHNLSQIRGVKMVAVADPVQERAQERAAQFGARAFASWKEMLKTVPMDAMYVAVPPFAHEGQEQEAARLGIHLFVEKPTAIDLKTARSIHAAVQKAGIVATAGFQDRYQDIVRRMKELLLSHRPGLIMGYWMGGMPGVHWWRVKAQSGGQALEQTIHTFDMARYLFGEVASVHTVWSTGLMTDVPDYDIEDATAVNLQFESGLCGTIFSGCFLKGYSKVGLDIWCPTMRVEYSGRSSLTIHEVGKQPRTVGVKNNFLLEIDKTFIAAVKKGDRSLLKSSYTDACRTLAVVLAANESIATGKVVRPAQFAD